MPRIAIFLPDTSDNYFVNVLMGVAQYSRSRAPWQFDLASAGDMTLTNLRELACDGIILGADERYPELARAVLSVKIPAVNVARAQSAQFPQVLPDDVGVGRLVARTFLERGFRNFGYCSASSSAQALSPFDHNRFQGFREQILAAGCSVSLHDLPVNWGEFSRLQDHAKSPLAPWLSQLRLPAAVLSATDVRGRQVLLVASQIGLRVPEDLAVIGVDNSAVCEVTSPGLSSVQLDGRKAGYTAAGVLDQLMHGQSPPVVSLIPPLRLIERRSSDVLAMEDPEVAEAFRFIAENARRPIHVNDVVATVPISRRVLERRFRRVLGRSIQEEIQRVHVQRAKLLLADEDLSIARVASAAGFTSGRHLSVAFRRFTGTTPTAFRGRALSARREPTASIDNGNSS